MPRKFMQRSLTCKGQEGEGGGYRRSPRLCSIESWKKAQKSKHILAEKKLGPCLRRRVNNRPGRRKVRDLSPVDEEGSESLDAEDTPSNKGQPKRSVQLVEPPKVKDRREPIPNRDKHFVMLFEPRMPDKSQLGLVLDILQRRDTDELFGQPVDGNEVEDYYEIIDEPMDFGTMRAKLHEGQYINLEQFENDVFLICRNAMHFNSSRTTYFKVARAIDELAKKVFHVLKTEPENLESEFWSTKRRSGRRPVTEASLTSSPKRSFSLRPSSLCPDPWLKGTQLSLDSSFKSRSIFQGAPVCLGSKATPIHSSSAQEALYGAQTNWWSMANSIEDDRRSTYKTSLSTISNKKTLTILNQQDLSYSDSLMMFTKKLGPTAQMVAKRKLLECLSDSPVYQTPTSFLIQEPNGENLLGSLSSQLGTFPTRMNISNSNSTINDGDIVQKPYNNGNGFVHIQQPKIDPETSRSKYTDLMALDPAKLTTSNFPPIKTVFTIDDLNVTPTTCLSNTIGSLSRTSYKPIEANQPIINTVSTIADLNLQPPPSPGDELEGSSMTGQASEINHLTTQYGYQCVFDLPYLKSRLSEMNSLTQQDLFLRQCADTRGVSFL